MSDRRFIIIASSHDAAEAAISDNSLRRDDVRVITHEFSLSGIELVEGRYLIAEGPGIIPPRMWRKIEALKEKAAGATTGG